MAGGERYVIRIERRLEQPLWLSRRRAVRIGRRSPSSSCAAVLAITGHDPITTYRRIFDAAFVGSPAWTDTLMSATPLLFTGLAAAVAFRMQLYNIGAEGQLYIGAICGAGAAIWLGPHHGIVFTILFMCACAAGGRRALGADRGRAEGVRPDERDPDDADAQLRRRSAADLPDLRQRLALARRLDGSRHARSRRRSRSPTASSGRPGRSSASSSRSASCSRSASPIGLTFLFRATRFGFEMNVIGDSPRAARYAGMRTRRKILAVMGLSGAVAGLGGASQVGDFSHVLDASPQGLQGANYGYAGIVVAALGPLQPVRRLPRRGAARRPAERGTLPAGARLPVGARRRDAGDHPLLHARRRAPDPLPRPLRRAAASRARRPSRPHPGRRHELNNSFLVIVLAQAVLYGTPILFAALGELLAERSGVINLGVEGMMLVGRRDGVLGLAARSRPGRRRARCWPCSRPRSPGS